MFVRLLTKQIQKHLKQKENVELRETIRKLKGMVNYILAAEKISNNLMNNMTEPVELIIGKKN